MLGDGARIRARRDDDRNPELCCRRNIHIIDADAGSPDCFQIRTGLHRCAINRADANDNAICIPQFRQHILRFARARDDDVHARILEHLHARIVQTM